MDEDEVKEKISSFDIPPGTDPIDAEKIICENEDSKMEKDDSSPGDRERKQSNVSCDKSDSIRMDSDIESLSSHPDTSTPVHKNVRVNPSQSTVQFDIDTSSLISESRFSSDFKETISPEDVKVPIMGYEIMEERAKFTVFKIKVEKEGETWFVFRRYTDFVQLNSTLRKLYPHIRFSLPPKRWFRDNFDKNFIEDRLLGLQAFVDNCTCHKDICNCNPVREFFCFDDPPGPHESLEESRAVCETLEDSVYRLRHELDEKDTELKLLQEELSLYKKQVEMLTEALRSKNDSARSLECQESASSKSLDSPDSPGSTSLAECDLMTCPESDQSHMQNQDTSATSQEEIAPEIQEKSRGKKKEKSSSIFKFRRKQTT